MTKLEIDTNRLKQYVLPELEDSIESLNSVVTKFSNLSVPYDFRYRSKIYSISSEVQSVRDGSKEIYKILDTTAKKINYNEQQMEKLLYSLSRNQIIVRNLY